MPTLTQEDLVAVTIAAREALDARLNDPKRPQDNPPIYGRSSGDGLGTSIGDAFVKSRSYKSWTERFPSGGPQAPGNFSSDPVRVGSFRALVTSADASAGELVRPDYKGLLEPGIVRPLTLRQLVTVLRTDSDTVEWIREASRISAAAPVAEATATTGTSGTKPEAGLAFSKEQAITRTFAVWIPATRRVIADASGLRQYIDTVLTEDLGLELEDQMLAGSGVGENFRGILNDPGVITVGPPGAGQSIVHVIRRGLREVRVQGRTQPTAILSNPADVETIDLLERNDEPNNFVGDVFGAIGQPRLFGVPVVESDAVPAGTAIVGDFRRAILFDREDVTLAVGTINDDFVRNIVRVLAEMRAAFAVVRPKAFALVDLAA
jgi:HK97 family phage major capsid protein